MGITNPDSRTRLTMIYKKKLLFETFDRNSTQSVSSTRTNKDWAEIKSFSRPYLTNSLNIHSVNRCWVGRYFNQFGAQTHGIVMFLETILVFIVYRPTKLFETLFEHCVMIKNDPPSDVKRWNIFTKHGWPSDWRMYPSLSVSLAQAPIFIFLHDQLFATLARTNEALFWAE